MKSRFGKSMAALALVSLPLAACSTATSTAGTGGGNGGGNGGNTPPLVMTAGGGTSFPRNFNMFSPTGGGPWTTGDAFIYEPLVAVDRSTPTRFQPWLATKWVYSDGGKALTFTIRSGVKWSDGKPLTAADVAYSLDQWHAAGSGSWTKITTSGDTVTVHYPTPSYSQVQSYIYLLIVPKHIWAGHKTQTWTDPDPVGTGPAVLTKFTPQAMFYKLRDDYWGGAGKGVHTLEIVTSANPDALISQLNSGKIDWGGAALPSNGKQFTSTDPAHHQYTAYSNGASEGVIFNTSKPPFNDVNLRRAMVNAADVPAVQKAANEGLPVPSVTGLDPAVWKNMIAPPYNTPQSQNVDQAKKDLAADGWTVKNGKLVKGGKSYSVTYTVPSSNAEWVTEAQLLAQQWKNTLGLDVNVNQVGDNTNSAVESKGTFDLAMTACAYNYWTLAGAYAPYSKKNNVAPGKPASSNIGRWYDSKFQNLLDEYQATDPTNTAKMQQLAQQLTALAGQDAPFLPTHAQTFATETSTVHWTGWPARGAAYVPNAVTPADAIETILKLSPTGN